MKRLSYSLAAMLLSAVVLGISPPAAQAQIYRLPRPDGAPGDYFGGSVAIDGDRVLIGATGVETCAPHAGAAYLYRRTPDTGHWVLEARLEPSECAEDMFFGHRLALAGDRAVVSAFRNSFSRVDPNAAYVFEKDADTGEWRQTARLTSRQSVDEGPFGAAVAMEGDRIVVTTAGDVTNGRFGGAAYVYHRKPSGVWRTEARLTGTPGERGVLGGDAALDGDRLAVAASTYFRGEEGSVHVFERAETGWQHVQRLDGLDDFFIAVDLQGDRLVAGESRAGRDGSGSAQVFRATDDGWRREATLTADAPFELGAFGSDVALQGERALVVGYDEQLRFEYNIGRVVYVFERDPANGQWQQRHIIDIGEVHFGSAIAVDGSTAVIGQSQDDRPGTAFVVQIH